jgi:hypothetical protein
MVDYTRQIKTATQAASKTPVVQPPSASLAGDIVNAVGTGLQFFSQQQAREDLQNLTQAQASQEEMLAQADVAQKNRISKGILDYRNHMQEVSMNPSISKGQVFAKEREYWSKRDYSSSERESITRGTHTLTKKTSFDIAEEADKNQEEYKVTLMQGHAYASQVLGIPKEELNTATPEQLEGWSGQASLFDTEMQFYKKKAEVSSQKTEPVVQAAMLVQRQKTEVKLNRIQEAYRNGDVDLGRELGDELRNDIYLVAQNGPTAIKNMVGERFYDSSLVNTYSANLMAILDDPSVRDMLSGKTVDENTVRRARMAINVPMSNRFIKLTNKYASGDKMSGEDVQSLRDTADYFSNKDISGAQFQDTLETAMQNALLDKGVDLPTAPTATNTNNSDSTPKDPPASEMGMLDSIFELVNNAPSAISRYTSSVTEFVRGTQKGVFEDKLEKGKEITNKDAEFLFESLSHGLDGTTQQRGKGASKANLQASLDVLSREDYETVIKPIVEKQIQSGIDPSDVLVRSLQNHIKNNFANAYRPLMGLATSGQALSSGTGISIDKSRPSFLAVTGRQTYNLRDEVELRNEGGQLTFGFKAGTLGQHTDIVKIAKMRELKNILPVVNKFITAMANVNGVDKKGVADEVMYLLASGDLNIPIRSLNVDTD